MGLHEHRRSKPGAVACAVLTISDTRTLETDESGRLTRDLLERAGHRIVHTAILPDDPERVGMEVTALLLREDVEAVLINGGTGISPRDRTHEAVSALLEGRLDGFGELFRMLSYQEVGAAAMLSRAAAGVARGKVLASLPGAPAAVELGMARLLIPELAHMVDLLRG